jgi:HD-GYP domain-containing protein (c-di-GMP phosphodiesterase class II)
VSEYCEAIGRALRFNERETYDLKTAGILHDIGKIMVPFDLLNKSEKLSEEEFGRIKRHPEISYQILKGVDEYAAFAEAVLHHHERFDGLGYPKGLKGDEIPIQSRIIAIADAYEAMTAQRAYRKPRSKEEAVNELRRCAGTHFDPEIVSVFVEKVLI